MCGIAGFNWNDKELVKKMGNSLIHRGPDQEGYYSDHAISLGHRRLSIIDLSEKGKQPMTTSEEDLVMVFNGEIYNFQELREELKEFNFQSESDTEVILYAYKKWGMDCFNKFNGMWALCIYDKKKNELILCRDRLGKKPLFYYWDKKKFIFASELKAILLHDIKKDINKGAVDFHLSMGFIPSPQSIYKNISKVMPRECLVFNLKTKKIMKKIYYHLPEYNPQYDKKKLIDEGSFLLNDATRLRLIADVPVGAFLSGGLDSSSVVATMSKFVDLKKLHTFSIGFEGSYDETKYVNIVKKKFKTRHHHKYFTEKDFIKLLNKISYFYDEPFGDFSNFPTYDVSRLAREHVTVVLSGDGGDEVFGGYPTHQIAAQFSVIKEIPKSVRKFFYSILPKKNDMSFFGRLSEALRMSFIPDSQFYSEVGSAFVYKPKVFKDWSKEKMEEVLKISKGNFTEAMIKYDLFYNTLADNFLVKVDRASMANSLEVRSPFLDYRFIDFSARIPVKWKCNIFKTKILMRDLIKGLVPKAIVFRGKQGFTPPIVEWTKKKSIKNKINVALEELYKHCILDENWYSFYKKINDSESRIHQNYKIRLLLLFKWYELWVLKNESR
ncbi:asparagine synthase (glutamine-hydrolyzing) [Candidatus Woesearchaeota archaeon CG10_big_fil_rev_8_21_14_0_10_37_12]|nr:MAG: asparagine synthase (glutamine-hydrolyzing) [Candidatus Woesearchaeota archaeon CG10_big_fil_rev_8_21_14_0_10_37_12]